MLLAGMNRAPIKWKLWYPQHGFLTVNYDEDGSMKIPEQLKWNVAFLHVFDDASQDHVAVGSGFNLAIIEYGLVFGYLVTCKHVIKPHIDVGKIIQVRLNRLDIEDVEYLPLDSEWIFHEDSDVDIAIMQWMPPAASERPVGFNVHVAKDILLTDDILKRTKHTIKEGDEVVFTGMFGQYIGHKRNIPVVRSGAIALVTDEKTEGIYGLSEQYFIECQAYPGNSGSPLYILLNDGKREKFFVMGIIAGFYPSKQKLLLHSGEVQLYTHFGISTAIPIQKVRDVLYGDKLMSERKKRIDEKLKKNAPEPASIIHDAGEDVMTKEDFMKALRKVSRPLEDQPDSEKSET